MNDERYSIIYSSRTGNTRLLAEAIRESLPADLCDHFGTDEAGAVESEKLYVGFWTDKGTADEAALALLKRLKNKKIFLFGTAGFGESEAYFQKVLDRVKESIDESNSIIGTYMCQGKMPMAVRERYEKMKQQPNPAPNLDGLIRNFDRALTHPDDHDLEELKQAVRREGGQLIWDGSRRLRGCGRGWGSPCWQPQPVWCVSGWCAEPPESGFGPASRFWPLPRALRPPLW